MGRIATVQDKRIYRMSSSALPTVSVIVPVYNDPTGLRSTLDSLVDQGYPTDRYEVVVVDNDSTDETLSVARDMAASHSVVRVERETSVQGSYAARNTGIRESSGEYLAFVDADVVVDRDWLETGISELRSRDADYMGCRVDISCPERTLAGLFNTATGFPVRRYVEENEFAPTCALFVDRDVFRDLGYFDADLVSGGDTEFGQRVANSGRELHYSPAAGVTHPARTSLRSLLEKYVRVGRGVIQRRRKYPDRYAPLPLYHPIMFLPPHPLRFHRHFGSDWDELAQTEKVGLYGVGYLRRLAETTGRLAERFGRT